MHIIRAGVGLGLFVALVFGVLAVSSQAQEGTSSSPSYEMSEAQFGSGSELETCSGSYCAQASIGRLGPDSNNPPSSASFGLIPEDSEPLLEVIVDPGESDLGMLSSSKTSSKTMIVRIRAYMSDGYTLQINGDPPSYDVHSLSTASTPTASTPGLEQFGINVVNNPTLGMGASPVHVPSEVMSFGEVLESYSLPDMFMYRSGDVVAASSVETGRTDYTVSMIINVSNSTPAGHYNGDYSAIVIPRF